jgi:outer membrane protein TolC
MKYKFLLLAFLTVFAAKPVFAAEVNLTVEDAVDYIIKNGAEMKKNAEDQTLNTKNNKTIKDQLTESAETTQVLNLTVSLLQNEIQATQYIENETNIREKTAYAIEQLFSSIIAAEKDVGLFDQNLKITAKDLEISAVKHKYGLISADDFAAAQTNYDKAIKSRLTKTNAISAAYIALNREMGVNLNSVWSPVLESEYKPIGDVSIATAVSKAQNKSADLKNLASNVEMAKYKYDTLRWELDDSSNDNEEALQIALTQAERAYNDKKTSIESSVISAYSAILQTEADYDVAIADLATAQKQLETTRLQLKLGKTTALAVEKLEYQIAQQQESIRKQIVSHALKVEQFNIISTPVS